VRRELHREIDYSNSAACRTPGARCKLKTDHALLNSRASQLKKLISCRQFKIDQLGGSLVLGGKREPSIDRSDELHAEHQRHGAAERNGQHPDDPGPLEPPLDPAAHTLRASQGPGQD
jgi:hypothetical protein